MTFHGVMAVGALALAALCPAPAQAQAIQNLFNRIIGADTEEPAINYSERAPLVIPPKREMRQPTDAAALEQDPAWPKDPDAGKARKKANPESRGPVGGNSELATRDEMDAGTLTGPSQDQRTQAEIDQEFKRMSNPVNPKVLARRGSFGPQDAPLQPGIEPPRRSLVDPPKGLRTPLATAPLGGDEPLPSEADAKAHQPWYQKIWDFQGK
jgi:hypothetical protein